MKTTRQQLKDVLNNVEESIGGRREESRHNLSPVPTVRDIGRRANRTLGQIDIDELHFENLHIRFDTITIETRKRCDVANLLKHAVRRCISFIDWTSAHRAPNVRFDFRTNEPLEIVSSNVTM